MFLAGTKVFLSNLKMHRHYTLATCGRLSQLMPSNCSGKFAGINGGTANVILDHWSEWVGRCDIIVNTKTLNSKLLSRRKPPELELRGSSSVLEAQLAAVLA